MPFRLSRKPLYLGVQLVVSPGGVAQENNRILMIKCRITKWKSKKIPLWDKISLLSVHGADEVGHLNGGQAGAVAIVASFAPRAIDSLIDGVCGQDAEYDRHLAPQFLCAAIAA